MENGSPLYSILYLKSYQFYLEILIPMLLLMRHSKRRKYFWIFLPIVIALPCFMYWVPTLTFSGYNFNYLVCSGILFVLSFLLYDESPLTLLCATFISFGVQHISWNAMALFFDLMPNNAGDWPAWATTISMFTIYILLRR